MIRKSCFRGGQSLVELAVFASVIFVSMGALVSYIMSYNYTQRVAMHAFQRAMKLANDAGATYFTANINLLYDKAVADPSSMFGIPKKTTLSIAASGIRSNELYSEQDWGQTNELPRTVYDINGKAYTFLTGEYLQGGFRYSLNGKNKVYYDASGRQFRTKDWRTGWWKDLGANPQAWRWKYGTGNTDEKVEKGTQWDLDNDEEDELILAIVAGTGMDTIQYVDYQGGDIDGTIADDELRNGIIPQFYEGFVSDSSLSNKQGGSIFSTFTKIKTTRIIERYIRLNHRKGITGFPGVVFQIKGSNPGCPYDANCSCTDQLFQGQYRHCDCIGDKDYIVKKGLFPLYPTFPLDIYGAVKAGNFYRRGDTLGVNADKVGTGTTEKVDLLSGNYFLVVRSVFTADQKAYEWTRDNKK